jgi:hypothetical protein
VVVVEHNSTIPVQSHKGPGKRARDSWDVDEPGMRVVAEVKRRQVEEVDDQDDLSPDEVSADEKHHEGKLQEVVEDEVASNPSGSLDMFALIRK